MTDQGLAIIKKVLTSTDIMNRFASLMGERESTYYINSVILTVANSEELQKCTPTSIVFSALRAASLKLSCDQALGEAYLVPFNNNQKGVKEAVFIPGYKGLRNLATRTNKYRHVNAGQVFNGEQMQEDRLTGQMKLIGKRIDDTIVGWFAYFEMFSGYSKTLYMTVEEIHDHAKQYSKTYNSKKSLWQTDPQKAEKKTVLRLLLVRWGDLGEAGNAFIDDEIIDSEFKVEIPPDEEPKPKRTNGQNLRDLGFESDEPEPVQTDAEDEPQPAEVTKPEPESPAEPEQPTPILPIHDVHTWPDDLIKHLISCNIGVKDPAKVPDMLNRSKLAMPTTQRRYLEMWVNWYCQERKQSKDELQAADTADNRLADVMAANGKH